MPGKEVYEVEAVPVYTGGGMDQAPAGAVFGTVVGQPATTMNSLAAGYGGENPDANWEPAAPRPARRCSAAMVAAWTMMAVLLVVAMALGAGGGDGENANGRGPQHGADGADGQQVLGPTATPTPGSPPPPPPRPAPPPPLQFAVTLNEDISNIQDGTAERAAFERAFAADLAVSLGVSAADIRVLGVTAGSVSVTFEVARVPTNLDVLGVLTVQRPSLAGRSFQAVVEIPPAGAANTGACTSRLSCATLAMPDMVAQGTTHFWVAIEDPANAVALSEWQHPTNTWPADDGFITVPLSFDYQFYGIPERSVSVGTNGYLTFGQMDHYPYGNTLVIPTPGGDIGGASVDGLVAVMWTDLDPSVGGQVYHQGNHEQQVVTWQAVPYFSHNRTAAASSPGSTFQSILYASGDMVLQYQHIERPDLINNPSVTTGHATPSIGFENHDGSKGAQVTYGWQQAPPDGAAYLVREGMATWVLDRVEHTLDSALVCGESHLESHVFAGRVAARGETLADRAVCHGHDDTVTSGWEHAANLCGILGSRLCTLTELEDGETAASGCAHDNEQTWAIDKPVEYLDDEGTIAEGRSCPDSMHWATSRTAGVYGDPSGAPSVPGRMCVEDGSNLAVRCCADAVVGTPCAMPAYTFPAAFPAPSPVPHATPVVEAMATSIDDAHVTLRLSLTLGPEARNVYALHGGTTTGSPLYFPPAYQVTTPFGVHVGGVNPALWGFVNAADPTQANAQWDSWLTVGITDGDHTSSLGSVGIGWSSWDESNALVEDGTAGGAVFCMNPGLGPTMAEVVVAQLTLPVGRVGVGDSTMIATMGVQGRSKRLDGTWQLADGTADHSLPDWNQDHLVFQL